MKFYAMNETRVNNHYVPECYLKHWADGEGKVQVFKTLVRHAQVPVWRKFSTSSVAHQKNLYTQIIAGKARDDLERWFDTKFESPASIVLDKVTNEAELSRKDWSILIQFLTAQDVRTPFRMLEHLNLLEKIFPEEFKNMLETVTEELEEFKHLNILAGNSAKDLPSFPLKITPQPSGGSNAINLKVETYAGRSTWIHSIKHLLTETSLILHKHKWTIIKPSKGYFWPTSDNPVAKINYYKPGNYDLRGGWGVENGNILFPIAPEHAMFVQIGRKPIQKNKRVSEDLTKELIQIITTNAHRSIFCNQINEEIPAIRPREVNSDKCDKERKAIQRWQNSNSDLESIYF